MPQRTCDFRLSSSVNFFYFLDGGVWLYCTSSVFMSCDIRIMDEQLTYGSKKKREKKSQEDGGFFNHDDQVKLHERRHVHFLLLK